MELTVNGFLELLEKRYEIIKYGNIPQDDLISGISLLTNRPLDHHILYLNPGPDFESAGNVLNIVTNETAPSEPGYCLPCRERSILMVVNDCFQLWHGFLQWREQCRELALFRHDLSGLLEAGAQYIGADMVIIDRDYRFDGGTLSKDSPGDDFFTSTDDMDAKAVEDLYVTNPRFDETFQTDGLVHYPYTPNPDENLYYYNLRYDRLYLGRLLFRIPAETDTACFRQLADGFGALVSACYEFHYLRKNKGMPRHSVYDIWKLLLEGKPVDQETANQKLRAMGWESDHRYQILYLISNGYFRSPETLKFYAVQLEQVFPACIAAQMGEGVYLLHDLDRENEPDFRQRFADFLRENLFICGISNVFRDFYDSDRYSRQAKEALELGIRRNPNLWRHEFRSCQSDYVFQQCLSHYTARDLCPEELEKLLLHDEQHPEMELAKTLEMYYNCKFNAAEAAKGLFIHRTTMFYRLNKIQQIAAIDHDDPELRLQIQLCFALLREERQRKNANQRDGQPNF